MYVLDTNVISELRKTSKGNANQNVTKWASSVPASALFLSAMTVLELERGTLLLERHDTRQGSMLRSWLEDQVFAAFAHHILPIDAVVARRAASLHIPNPRPERDALIAATALVHGMTVATRNVADFKPMGAPFINPWEA